MNFDGISRVDEGIDPYKFARYRLSRRDSPHGCPVSGYAQSPLHRTRYGGHKPLPYNRNDTKVVSYGLMGFRRSPKTPTPTVLCYLRAIRVHSLSRTQCVRQLPREGIVIRIFDFIAPTV